MGSKNWSDYIKTLGEKEKGKSEPKNKPKKSDQDPFDFFGKQPEINCPILTWESPVKNENPFFSSGKIETKTTRKKAAAPKKKKKSSTKDKPFFYYE